MSEVFEQPLTLRGAVTAHLIASTTGSDADWVVKLIDVYPDDAPGFAMSGYQLMISGDIFRGRYREDYDQAKPLTPDVALEYTIPLPHVTHTIRAGHRPRSIRSKLTASTTTGSTPPFSNFAWIRNDREQDTA